jgi:hypothetical protein
MVLKRITGKQVNVMGLIELKIEKNIRSLKPEVLCC